MMVDAAMLEPVKQLFRPFVPPTSTLPTAIENIHDLESHLFLGSFPKETMPFKL